MIIESKVLGQRRRPFEPWELSLFPETHTEQTTLRELLTRIVLQEVEAFLLRQEERKLERVLSAAEIASQANRGKVDMGGRDLEQTVDGEAAVTNALVAFEDGFYYVFIDGQQVHKLNEAVSVRDDGHMLFVRLMPLIGG